MKKRNASRLVYPPGNQDGFAVIADPSFLVDVDGLIGAFADQRKQELSISALVEEIHNLVGQGFRSDWNDILHQHGLDDRDEARPKRLARACAKELLPMAHDAKHEELTQLLLKLRTKCLRQWYGSENPNGHPPDHELRCAAHLVSLLNARGIPIAHAVRAVLNDPNTWACQNLERKYRRMRAKGAFEKTGEHLVVEQEDIDFYLRRARNPT